MAIVRTTTGDVPADELGACYSHEHLLGAPPGPGAEADLVLDDVATCVAELRTFVRAGGRALVEMSTRDYNRDAAGLRRLSQETGVHVVCATGYNKDVFSQPFVEDRSVEELAVEFVGEVTVGIDGTGVRAGVVKASSTLNCISPVAEKVFRAAARTHLRTGVPVSTHTEAGTMGLEQVALLTSEGVDPAHVVIGHADRRLDWDYHRSLAATGVHLSFDQIGKEKYARDTERAAFIVRLVHEGFGRQVLLGGDLARRSYWPSYGSEGPGFGYILERFVPLLRTHGLSPAEIDDLLVANPARAFRFRAGV